MTQTHGHTLDDSQLERGSPAAPRAGAAVYVLLEGDRPSAGSSRHELSGVRTAALGRGETRAAFRPAKRAGLDLQIEVPDAHMSSNHALISQRRGRWTLEDAGSRNGTFVNGERHLTTPLSGGDIIELGHTVLLFQEDVPISSAPDTGLSKGSERLLTLAPALEKLFRQLRRLAPAPGLTILIEGETGTGKEVLARQIADWSGRQGRFIGVNCGAIADTIIESELFGALKGAFSGASVNRQGLVRAAHEGCLFLDEIADLSSGSQAALLRVLQEREVIPVGGTVATKVDIKVIAATHQDLDLAVKEGRFRKDLLARLSGFRVKLPPLRQRKEDLGLIISALMRDNSQIPPNTVLTPQVIRQLLAYSWPLNVRELGNALAAAALLAENHTIQSDDLPQALREAPAPTPKAELSEQDEQLREELRQLLKEHQGNISAIARHSGKARMQIQRWCRRFDLEPANYR